MDDPALAKQIFLEGINIGYFAKIAMIGEKYANIDLHFLSLGAAETAVLWWFEDFLIPHFFDCGKEKIEKCLNTVEIKFFFIIFSQKR